MTRDELIERMARRKVPPRLSNQWAESKDGKGVLRFWQVRIPEAKAEIDALCEALPGLADVIDGKAVIVPITGHFTQEQIERGQKALEALAAAIEADHGKRPK